MYELLVDGKQISREPFVEPLIMQLGWRARHAGFEVATIWKVPEPPTLKTPLERIQFEKDWDRRVREGKERS